MKMELDSIKRIYQSYVASRIPQDRTDCPSPRFLLKTIGASGSFRKKRGLIDHISKCSYCKEELFLLIKLNSYSRHELVKINATLGRHSSFVDVVYSTLAPRLLTKYASILVGVTLLLSSVYLIQKKEDPGGGQRRNNQIIQLMVPTDTHFFPSPLIFKWQECPEAQYYILELFDDTLLPLWESPKITELTCCLPEEIRGTLKINKYYFWMIHAFSSTGNVAESDLASFFTLTK